MKCVRYPGGGRGYSRNLSMGCVSTNMEFLGHSREYSVSIWTSDCWVPEIPSLLTFHTIFSKNNQKLYSFYIKISDCLPNPDFYTQSRLLERHTLDSSAHLSPFISFPFQGFPSCVFCGVLFNFCALYWH